MEVILLNSSNKVDINANNNKDSNININVYESRKDELSLDNLNESTDIFKTAKEFDKRIDFSCTVFNNELLPPALRQDFDIRYKKEGKSGYYYLYPTTKDAYKKFPASTTFTMKFPTLKEKQDFQKGGLAKLQAIANKTQKPVPIPYIVAAKEFIGIFENPLSYINRYGWGNSKLLILPEEIPPAQSYIIKLFNSEEELTIETSLCITPTSTAETLLTNKESSNEPFDIIVKMLPLKKKSTKDTMIMNFSITIRLKENVKKDYECNLKLLKFIWLINDKTATFVFKSTKKQTILLKKQGCGTEKYTFSEYKKHKRYVQLMEDVIQIIELSGTNIEFDLSKPHPDVNKVKIAKKLLNFQKCYLYKKTHWTLSGITNDLIERINSQSSPNYSSTIKSISILGANILLPENILLLKEVKILNNTEKDGVKIAKIVAKSVTITPTSKI